MPDCAGNVTLLFSDGIADWALDSVKAVYEAGVIDGAPVAQLSAPRAIIRPNSLWWL